MQTTDLLWLAGLLEGEGCFTAQVRHLVSGDRHSPKVTLKMTDEDVVRRAAAVADCGHVGGPYFPKSASERGKKQYWVWQVSNSAHARKLMRLLQPHMGARRSARIAELVAL